MLYTMFDLHKNLIEGLSSEALTMTSCRAEDIPRSSCSTARDMPLPWIERVVGHLVP